LLLFDQSPFTSGMNLHRLAQRAATRAVTRSFSRVQTHPARLARFKSSGSNTGRKQEAPNGFDTDEPIKYENQQEAWKESFLTPYMLKYPVLRKTAQTIYNGLGLYRKQNDAIRNSKYWYMRCAERDIMEREFLYKGAHAIPDLRNVSASNMYSQKAKSRRPSIPGSK
jgi:hypothetical protein